MGTENEQAKRRNLGVEYEPFNSAVPIYDTADVDAVNNCGWAGDSAVLVGDFVLRVDGMDGDGIVYERDKS
jgi:hypothetical protein